MAQDPRRFTVKHCPKTLNATKTADKEKTSFFNDLGKIGDIEVLNRFGDGKITSGLRSLSKISDSIRTGDTDSAIIPNSRGYVLDAVAINQNAAEKAGKFNPGVLNRGYAQADSILSSVKKGKFKLEDIPNTVTDLQNLGQLIDGIYNDGTDQNAAKEFERLCGATPYAVDLVRYAPKYKFLFIVQVTLSTPYNSLDNSAKKLAFVVKSSTRPNVNIEHEEVNMYNFWTRIPKRTVYEPITMRFYDDNKGLAHLFYTSYLESISPIARLGGIGQAGEMTPASLEEITMEFNSISTAKNASSLTALEGENTSIISEISLYHFYDYGKFMNVYHFYQPKLLTMNLDDLDVADNGGGSEIEFQFAYDALHITPAYSVQDNISKIGPLTGGGERGALYPIKPNFLDSDIKETPEGVTPDGNPPKPTIVNVQTSNVFSTATGFT